MNNGGIIIRVGCACGHRAALTDTDFGQDPATFEAWHRLRCKRCVRRGKPVEVVRSWSSGAEHAPYRGELSEGVTGINEAKRKALLPRRSDPKRDIEMPGQAEP